MLAQHETGLRIRRREEPADAGQGMHALWIVLVFENVSLIHVKAHAVP